MAKKQAKPKPASFVSMSEYQVRLQILNRYSAHLAEGDEPEVAMAKAGAEFRAQRQKEAADAIAYLEYRLGK